MNVSIIGAGNMGRGIGTRMVSGGHSVTVVDQNAEAAENLATELRALSRNDAKVSTASLENVVPGDVVVLAVWYGVNMEVARKLGEKLSGKIVVDIANPLNASFDGLATAPGTSSAEDLAKSIAKGAKVVKAFNTTFAGTLVNGNVSGTPLDVFIAGDDEEAKKVVAKLVEDGGLVAVDAGPLLRSRELEALGLLGITLQIKHNLGFTTAWKLVRP
ncbi:MAG: NAD(P)-binding domain-containing protein [Anaerolineaceae bacterium]|nr:NAD(P)-binding domain-containing protein [Anaerolineaceae bacterium]